MPNYKIPQFPPVGRTPAAGDLLIMWDNVLSKTVNVDITDLPYGEGGGGGGTSVVLGSPFKVRNDDATYHFDGTNTIITDPRLLGKSDYVVSTTQLGIEFDDDQIECDPIVGCVTINNFQLEDGRHVTIYADGVTTTSASEFYASLTAQMTLFQQMLAPFTPSALGPNSGKVWWTAGADTIPIGWQECIAMRGMMPVHQDTTNAAIAVIGTQAGSATTKLLPDNIPPFTIPIGTDNKGGGGGYPVLSTHNVEGIFNLNGGGTGSAFSTLSPCKVGIWIEFIGV